MNKRNFLRRTLLTLLTVSILLFADVVGAAVKIFDGYGECEMGEFTTLPKAKERALERAKLDAQKQAGLYLKTESRSINSELVDEAISAVTNNIIEISGVQYETITQKITERTTAVVIVAKLKASIDPNGIYDWLKRDEKEKVTIIQQNDNLQEAIQKNDKEFEDLKEKYKSATSQAEKDRIIKQMEQVDRDFLANLKFKEGNTLYWKEDYDGAVKLLREAFEIKPDREYKERLDEVLYHRGRNYNNTKQYKKAVKEFDKLIAENGYIDWENYISRGVAYCGLKQYKRAIQDLDKAIELDGDSGNVYAAYLVRGAIYFALNQNERAAQDLDQALEKSGYLNVIERENDDGYNYDFDFVAMCTLRGLCYQQLGDDTKAKIYFSKLKTYDAKIIRKMIEQIYEHLGDNKKTRDMLNKAKELGFNS